MCSFSAVISERYKHITQLKEFEENEHNMGQKMDLNLICFLIEKS